MSDLLTSLDDFINTLKEANELLHKISMDSQKFHKKKNVMQGVGTMASLVGVGLALAPFTGGASVAGAAAFIGFAGGATTLSADAWDYFASKRYSNRIKAIDTKIQDQARLLQKAFEELREQADIQFKLTGDEELSMFRAVCIVCGAKWKFYTGSKMVKEGYMKLKPDRFVAQGIQKTPDIITKLASRVKTVDNLMKIIPKISKLSNLLVIWDVYSLAKSVLNDHPVVKAAAHQMDEITKTINQLTDTRDSIKGAL